MGLPWEELDTFLRLKDGIIRPGTIEMEQEERQQIQRDIGQELYAYFDAILDERLDGTARTTSSPGSTPRRSTARSCTREEILDICFLFFIAGLDTVTDSLSCFFAFLAEHPEHRRQLVEHPDIIPSAVEELLRWETPVPNVPRMATARSARSPGHTSSRRDRSSWSTWARPTSTPPSTPTPMEVRFDRDVNRHLAFGGGVHRCLGSHLARRELRVTLREWHRRIPEYAIKPGVELSTRPGSGWSRTWSWSGPRADSSMGRFRCAVPPSGHGSAASPTG